MKNNIIYCIDKYASVPGAGASVALRNLIISNPRLGSYKLYCKYYYRGSIQEIEPQIASGKDVVDEFINGNYRCIHWLRSESCELYLEIIKEIKRRRLQIPIISTICQQPDSPGLFLGPMEVKYPSHIIFIDNTAYNNKIFRFIPSSRKSMIRFGGNTKEYFENADRILHSVKKEKNRTIVFGRGSTLNKCPKNMFDVFDRIANPKKFVIVGDGNKNWIKEEISKRDYEIILMDSMPYTQWLKTVATFDIFLYHLPMDAYSSTDGTMMSALLMKKPVVYYGPEAPKEALIDNVNARIAQSEEQLVDFCNDLAKNEQERIRLGENARKSLEQIQTQEQFLEKINNLYDQTIFLSPNCLSIHYLYNYICYLLRQNWRIIHNGQFIHIAIIDNIRYKLALRTRVKNLLRRLNVV